MNKQYSLDLYVAYCVNLDISNWNTISLRYNNYVCKWLSIHGSHNLFILFSLLYINKIKSIIKSGFQAMPEQTILVKIVKLLCNCVYYLYLYMYAQVL